MAKHHVYSLFSGSGFLDLGFEDSGMEVVFVNEVYKPFLEAYKYSRKALKREEPLFGYSDESIEVFNDVAHKKRLKNYIQTSRAKGASVGFIGGPPCPDFSVGGKNKGSKGARGRLSRIYVDLIITQKPDWFVFENVKGLFRTAKHRAFFDTLVYDLKKAGYSLAYDILNSIEFGVPQDRDRIIVFGLKNNLTNKTTSKAVSNKDYLHYSDFKDLNLRGKALYPGRGAFEYSWPQTSKFQEGSVHLRPNNVPLELTIEHWFKKNNIENHPNSKDHFQPRAAKPKFLKVLEGDVSKKSFKRPHRWRYSPTAAYGNNEVHLHPYKARRLSVAEALAIQSLPKAFCLPPLMSLSDKFKTIGNGVPYLMALAISQTLKEYLENKTLIYSKISDKVAVNS